MSEQDPEFKKFIDNLVVQPETLSVLLVVVLMTLVAMLVGSLT